MPPWSEEGLNSFVVVGPSRNTEELDRLRASVGWSACVLFLGALSRFGPSTSSPPGLRSDAGSGVKREDSLLARRLGVMKGITGRVPELRKAYLEGISTQQSGTSMHLSFDEWRVLIRGGPDLDECSARV